LPERWPVYYKKAKGSYVWDLENNKYLDIGLMGVGTNILGYSNNQIDRAVSKAIFNGNMSSLNCIEEVELSKKLLSINPWAGMVKFARTGGEANAMAVRIARAASKNKNIAVCGYHGWHDWYLAANIESKKALNNHLMKGLNPIGVPSKLKSTIFPFEYNDFEKLKKLVKKNNIGIIKMEVARSFESPSFLRKIRKFCNQKNILLIFDECTSGFRETFGGLHL
ncbi:MAG: aminotransferase class III-fold pyridoxal phosphate-dependent enzyme, partial [SAR324 cluster bacterium]|nr:aminotransferase class III-fold pyridoxal phosphate-dependent enzyme [SAR324 cluster bacterium]